MRKRIGLLSGALMLVAVMSTAALSAGAAGSSQLASTIAFTSGRDNPTLLPAFNRGEIYLMDPDGANVRRLTNNLDGDGFPTLSPDGKRLVFDSNRNRAPGEPLNTSDLFSMNTADIDGTEPEQQFLTRGSSATWSPDSKSIAFHASASGTGLPIKPDPGAATTDSDIFVADVKGLADNGQPTNITNSSGVIDDDPDWSPDGQRIVYTRHPDTDDPVLTNLAEIYVINADGSGTAVRLTSDSYDERGPSWSPDGARIVFACRIGGGTADFEICVMNADGTGVVQLTDDAVQDLTPTFSPDGQQIVFHRYLVAGQPQLYVMNADGTDLTQVTFPPGSSLLANWGELKVHEEPAP
jgi:Tol biopolymer transport system component